MRTLTTITPTMKVIIAALKTDGDMDARDISETTRVAMKTLVRSGYLAQMVRLGLIWIVRFEHSEGAMQPIYSATKRKSAPRPDPLSNTQRSRKWRARVGFGSQTFKQAQALALLVGITGRRRNASNEGPAACGTSSD